jgi:hypothetical protein
MKCAPAGVNGHSNAVAAPTQESERILLVLTDVVLNELCTLFSKGELGEALQCCKDWGILEIIETTCHAQLMTISPDDERKAEEMCNKHSVNLASENIRRDLKHALKLLDFVSLWASQMPEGHVLLVTGESAFSMFASSVHPPLRHRTIHIAELERLFADDVLNGGSDLLDAAKQQATSTASSLSSTCEHQLSASTLARVAGLRQIKMSQAVTTSSTATAGTADVFRKELLDAVELVAGVRQLLGSSEMGTAELTQCMERLAKAQKRWELLLGSD